MVLELFCTRVTRLYKSQQQNQEQKRGLLPTSPVLNTHNCSLLRYLLDKWKGFTFSSRFPGYFQPKLRPGSQSNLTLNAKSKCWKLGENRICSWLRARLTSLWAAAM